MLLFQLLGRLTFLAFVGFVALMLIGPVLAVVGTLLPFAVVGVLVWSGYRLFRRAVGCPRRWAEGEHEVRHRMWRGMRYAGRGAWVCGARAAEAMPAVLAGARRAGEQVRDRGWGACRGAWEAGGPVVMRGVERAGQAARACGACAAESVPAVLARARQAGAPVRARLRFVARILWEVACGSLVGVTMGSLAGWQTNSVAEYVLLGGLMGAVLGLIVGVSRWEPARPAEG
jgi:hypothetical protein